MGTIQGYNFEIMIVNIFFHLLDFLMESLNTVVEKKGFAGKNDYDAIHVNVY